MPVLWQPFSNQSGIAFSCSSFGSDDQEAERAECCVQPEIIDRLIRNWSLDADSSAFEGEEGKGGGRKERVYFIYPGGMFFQLVKS